MKNRFIPTLDGLERRAVPSTIGPQLVDTTTFPATPNPVPPPPIVEPPPLPPGDYSPPPTPVA